MTTKVRPPRRFCRIIEAVCDRDREYFENHRDEVFFVRDYVPGELWPCAFPQRSAMLVRRLIPGEAKARWRSPLPNCSAEQIRELLLDPRITVFVPSLDGESMEVLE